jgi:hypothetical protein
MTEVQLQVLAFERRWWRYAGAKEEAIAAEFGVSPTRYYQQLDALVDTREALATDPLLVGRLRRLRGSRAQARTVRRHREV